MNSSRLTPVPTGAATTPSDPGSQDWLFRVAGLAAVNALFARNPDRVERLFYDERVKTEVGDFCRVLARRHRPYRLVGTEELARVAGTVLHGGIVAVTRPRPVAAFDIDQALRDADTTRGLIVLDGVSNPHNFGAIIRTAAYFGLGRVLISDHPSQAAPSEASYRVAEGGFEYVEVCRAIRLPAVLKRLRSRYQVVGTAAGSGRPFAGFAPDRPAVLVLGNEEDGLVAQTLAACEEAVTIPGTGQIQSLNVSAAAAILLFELTRRFVG